MNIKTIGRSSLLITGICICILCTAQDSLTWALGTIAVKRNGHEIGIGEKIPDISFEKILNYPATSTSVAQLNQKPMIIEFWHQYCSVCRGEIPRLNKLYEQYKDSVQFLMVTFQSETSTKDFMQQQASVGKPLLLPVVVEDTLLRKTFGHEGDPHVVWISSGGTVQAISNHKALDSGHITKWLKEKDIQLAVKSNAKSFHPDRPLLLSESTTGFDGLYSKLAGYIDSVPALSFHVTDMGDKMKILMTNSTADQLFKECYMRYDTGTVQFLDLDWMNKRIAYRYKDSSRISNWAIAYELGYEQLENFQRKHMYSFEMLSSEAKDIAELAGNALQELTRLFQIRPSVQTLSVPGLALVRLDDKERFKSKGIPAPAERPLQDTVMIVQNNGIWSLVNILNLNYHIPWVKDETGYSENVDITIPFLKNDLMSVRQRLQQYGLDLVPKLYSLPMLVLADE